ncbi:MAG: Holliday junction branch migration DNA helicase RuvB [Dehalococcoidia bacterium]|nr:Holliday junction branch migration DNA helicase RuvB [Dehalococcoidia bacterium]
MTERLVSGKPREEDLPLDSSLRPRKLDEYVGQEKVKENLRIAMTAAQQRGEPLDHVLLYGPPGLGKTTLASVIAAEMGVNIKVTSGPAIERPGDMAAIITGLRPQDILFIDEIHRLGRVVEEVLYPAMEDFFLSWVMGKGLGARSINLKVPPFTLIGATTRYAMISAPLRNRFGMVYRLDFYDQDAIQALLRRSAAILGVQVQPDGVEEMARRARGTPRVANRLLKRVRDYAQVMANGVVTGELARDALSKLGIDPLGLDDVDHLVMRTLVEKFDGGPVGLETIAASISEEADTIMDVYEPYLMQLGFISRTPRGRVATRLAYEHLGLPYKGSAEAAQRTLWEAPEEHTP